VVKLSANRIDDTLDTDDPEHISWLYNKSLQRAQEFNIQGVTYSKTQGVVKNIIPAIASTNAIIAASCCNEALKLATMINPCMGLPGTNNYMMYSGDEGIYTYTFEHLQKPDCPVCGHLAKNLDVSRNMTLSELIETLAVQPEA
jgi:NEDD8-activating enzyme E1